MFAPCSRAISASSKPLGSSKAAQKRASADVAAVALFAKYPNSAANHVDKSRTPTINTAMDLHAKYPGHSDLKARARRRLPHFVFEYLDSGTGSEATVRRNRAMLDQVRFMPAILRGPMAPDLSVDLFGGTSKLPKP